MKFSDQFEQPAASDEPNEPLYNAPRLLSVKLLFEEKPRVDTQLLMAELRKTYAQVDHPTGNSALLFRFPEITVEFEEGNLPAQCSIFVPDDDKPNVDIAPEALQQNWHWPEAAEAARRCRYELLVLDFMTRPLAYPQRLQLFMDFLVAVIRVAGPQVVYAVEAQKLLAPASVVAHRDNGQQLAALVNVRLFAIDDGQPGETLLDTVGLHLLGLPDAQIRCVGLDASAVAGLLWSYAYYLFQHGDVIDSGNTIAGLQPGSQWLCNRQMALADPERMVLDVQPT